MKYIPYNVNCGKKNMDIDAEILETAIAQNEKDAIFRLYGWNPPCVSLGRNQQDSFLDWKLLSDNNIF